MSKMAAGVGAMLTSSDVEENERVYMFPLRAPALGPPTGGSADSSRGRVAMDGITLPRRKEPQPPFPRLLALDMGCKIGAPSRTACVAWRRKASSAPNPGRSARAISIITITSSGTGISLWPGCGQHPSLLKDCTRATQKFVALYPLRIPQQYIIGCGYVKKPSISETRARAND